MKMKHAARFEKYRDDTVIQRSGAYAKWTLPQLMADLSMVSQGNSRMSVERDYQDVGALLVNNLASKLAGLLFPSSRPFFKIAPSELLVSRAETKGVKSSELNNQLARIEQEACQQLFANASYNQLVIALKHLIVTGNVLLYRDPIRKRSVAYGLESYSMRRGGSGEMLDCVLREFTPFDALPLTVQVALRMSNRGKYSNPEAPPNVAVYTRILRKQKSGGNVYYEVTQEADDIPIGTQGLYPEHLCPWQAVAWSLIAGEHYGRGLVEDYAGGFAKLSDTSHALTLYSIETLKVVNLVQPGMGADIDELAAAETGEYVQGQPGAVQAYESGVYQKIQVVSAEMEALMQRLSKAFMYTGSTRDAERVTAYELKQDALEAEKNLGGNYSVLAESMQVPLAHLLIMEVKPGMLEGLVTRDISLDIMAGIPALGRASDVQNLILAAQDAAAIIPALTQLDSRVSPQRTMDMIMSGASVDTALIHKTEAELKEQAKAQDAIAEGQQQMQNATAAADMGEQVDTLQSIQGV